MSSANSHLPLSPQGFPIIQGTQAILRHRARFAGYSSIFPSHLVIRMERFQKTVKFDYLVCIQTPPVDYFMIGSGSAVELVCILSGFGTYAPQ